jgi:hypothetical protein
MVRTLEQPVTSQKVYGNNMTVKKPKDVNDPTLFTPSAAAQVLGVTPRHIDRLVKDPRHPLEAVIPNKSKRITGDSLVASGVCRNCWTLRSTGGKCEC